MLLYKFFLDGTEVENPEKWESMVHSVHRDRELKGVFVTLDATLIFGNDGHAYLWNAFKRHGYCVDVELRILESRDAGSNYRVFYDGIIRISDVEFMSRQENLEDTIIVNQYSKCRVLDNSFFAKILNNQNVEALLTAGKSKNGDSITPCSAQPLLLFDPFDGTQLADTQTYGCIRWLDAFRYMIEFMTNSTVEFGSSIMEDGGEWSTQVLTYGYPIRRIGIPDVISEDEFKNNLPKITFLDLFKEIDFVLNLGLFIDNSSVKPKVRIELFQTLYKEDEILRISNIDKLTTKVSVDDIFANLRIGSETTLDQINLQFPDVKWVGSKKEQYLVVTDCNIDATKDIVGKFIRETNVIEEILINDPTNKTYDKDWFIIDCTLNAGVYEAVGTNWIDDTAKRFYNEKFINANIASRLFRSVPNAIADYLGDGDDTFLASTKEIVTKYGIYSKLDETFGNGHVRFKDDFTAPNFDANNRYGNGTAQGSPVSTINSRYDAPSGGSYLFETVLFGSATITRATSYFEFNTGSPTQLTSGTSINIFDASHNFVATAIVFLTESIGGGNYRTYISNVSNSFVEPLTAGHTIEISGVQVADVTSSALVTTNDPTIDLVFSRFDSLGVPIQDYISTLNLYAGPQIYFKNMYINMGANDYLFVYYKINQPAFVRIIFSTGEDSNFKCLIASNGGNVFQTYDPSKYPVVIDSFEQEMSKEDFDLILQSPLSLILYSQGAQSYKKGWIDQCKYDSFKGMAKMSLVTTYSENPEIAVPCDPTFGPEIVVDGDFADGGGNWATDGGVGSTWTVNTSGASYNDGGSGNGGSIIQFTADILEGKHKTIFTMIGRTQGEAYFQFSGQEGLHRIVDGTYTQIIDIIGAGALAITVTSDFDGVIKFVSVQKQLTCL